MLEKLKQVYDLYDDILSGFSFVCKKRCGCCCTGKVTMTGLEALCLVNSLSHEDREGVKEALRNNFPEKRYLPQTTTNGFAAVCIEGGNMNETENDAEAGRCPLLCNGLCVVYKARPFGCRSLWSEIDCSVSGYARIPPLALTLNTLFLQYIEQMDASGITGNFSELLLYMLEEEIGSLHFLKERAIIHCKTGKPRFLFNRKIPALMVPPEHRSRVKHLMQRLNRIGGVGK